jgi:uncharacterized protein YbjT (DUF2867 family)
MLGATGAVGGAALAELARLPQTSRVTLLNRRTIDLPVTEKFSQHVVDVQNPQSYASHLAGHLTALCTFGVGQPSKVSQQEFRQIDHDVVLAFAKACKSAGVQNVVLLGSVGSDPGSRSFYLRTKGELRRAIEGLGFASVTTFQPSMILTPENRYGFSQGLLLKLWPLVSTVLLGPLNKYRGIEVATLGKAMAHAATAPMAGHHQLHWADIVSAAKV